MPLSYAEFMNSTQAELVGGNVITGFGAKRAELGEVVDGRFELTDEGRKVMMEIEAGTYEIPAMPDDLVPPEMPNLPVVLDASFDDKGEVVALNIPTDPPKRGPGRPPKQQE